MEHCDIKNVLAGAFTGKAVTVCGWVRTARDSKNMLFIEINDGTSLKHLQLVIDKDGLPDAALCAKLGCSVTARGDAVAARDGQGVELNVRELTLIGDCPPEYPLQKKRHTLEFLRAMPHLRLRSNTFNAVFRLRSALSAAIHGFFQENGFLYVHTPLITGSDCEGAGEMFRVTTHPFSHGFETQAAYDAADFFGQSAGLSVSGQLEGETAAMAFGKIYTFGPSFRAENSNTPRHLAEYWHVEPELAFADLNDVLRLAENMMTAVLKTVIAKCPDELAFFEKHFESGLAQKLERVSGGGFAVLDYTEAVKILTASGRAFRYPAAWGSDLQTEHERYITEEYAKKPVFVINYPKAVKSFYMKQNADGRTVAAGDLLVPGVGEIIGGSEREADYGKLVSALKERGMNESDYAGYLDLRRYGTAPHGGFGLGLERLLMYLSGVANIRDVTLFPRAAGQLI
ncbi:MAG: asparagine--tRNA ligase [Clostridiales bacterium]|jgi:asparaginyl-tRNA synthetase|nr:asparagine--tRNA ligase [Clostridiales bacterium]